MKRVQAITLPCILFFISPLLYGQRFSEKTEYPIGIMGGFSGYSAPFLIRQNDELQRVLEKTRPVLLNPDTEKLERSIDSDHDYPGYSSHYKDPKFEALQKTSQAITEQIDTLHEDVLRESDGSNPDFKPVFDTEFVDDEISQTTNSSLSAPETQDTATSYFNADMINQCPGGAEGEGDSKTEPDTETVSPADEPQVNYTQVADDIRPEIAQADISGRWDQFAANIAPEKLNELNTQERLLHAFSNGVNRQSPDLVEVAPIPGMHEALKAALEQSPELNQNILAASVGAFGAAVQRSESHGQEIQVTPDLLSKFVANSAAITVIPESILKRLEPHMRYHSKYLVDIPEGSSNNDIALTAAENHINSFPSGCYSFKHHPINFIISERQDGDSNYLIYLTGSHLFLKTKSKEVVENFVKIAVESWHTEYKGVIQYNPARDIDANELGDSLGEVSISDKLSRREANIAYEQALAEGSYCEGEIIVVFNNFANIKEADEKIRTIPEIIELSSSAYIKNHRLHTYTVKKGQEKKLIHPIHDIDGVNYINLNRLGSFD